MTYTVTGVVTAREGRTLSDTVTVSTAGGIRDPQGGNNRQTRLIAVVANDAEDEDREDEDGRGSRERGSRGRGRSGTRWRGPGGAGPDSNRGCPRQAAGRFLESCGQRLGARGPTGDRGATRAVCGLLVSPRRGPADGDREEPPARGLGKTPPAWRIRSTISGWKPSCRTSHRTSPQRGRPGDVRRWQEIGCRITVGRICNPSANTRTDYKSVPRPSRSATP